MAISPFEFVKEYTINDTKFVIPDFQRPFIWKNNQIEDLFDSLFIKYPLPRFFVWTVGLNTQSPMKLYKFSTELQGIFSKPVKFDENEYNQNQGHIAICDGQQRLTSLLIGLKGYRLAKKRLYFDLFWEPNGVNERKRFHFLTESEMNRINQESEHRYVFVKDIFDNYIQLRENGMNGGRLTNQLMNLFLNPQVDNNNLNYDIARQNLGDFLQRFNDDSLEFVDIRSVIPNEGISEATEFFTRLNAGGKALSKNDILFSLLSKYFGDGIKDAFNDLIGNHQNNFKGIDGDFILRTCQFILRNQVLFNIKQFNDGFGNEIVQNWYFIREAISETLNYLSKLDVGVDILKSKNSIIPIIYHFYKKHEQLNNYHISNDEARDILKYIFRSNLTNFYGGQGNLALTTIKNNLNNCYEQNGVNFNFNFINQNLPQYKRLHLDIDDSRIEDFSKLKLDSKNERIIKLILRILTNNFNPNDDIEIDYIHPSSICSRANTLTLHRVDIGDTPYIVNNYKHLTNLLLLSKDCKRVRDNAQINDWVNTIFVNNNHTICKNGKNSIGEYYESHLIPIPYGETPNNHMSVSNFRNFYELRYQNIKNTLVDFLCF
ncbi:MAG: hypothetical protein RLZZ172_205 [Bacteroidota bacterium]|jgi:uncharacterized protein with ParB-like and HNH nuclease domain